MTKLTPEEKEKRRKEREITELEISTCKKCGIIDNSNVDWFYITNCDYLCYSCYENISKAIDHCFYQQTHTVPFNNELTFWKSFDSERPFGKQSILTTDGKHIGHYSTYKEDWLKEWDNVNPNLVDVCQICNVFCRKEFKVTHWMYFNLLFKGIE